ncbi:MAG: carboxypeptidase regulatory-like domain-containing protein [Deltaproteobacteria bacterium]|nr:carboxypeptidase regulatory-like domain-containing protein [Deltaproteobacteria bacterium]
MPLKPRTRVAVVVVLATCALMLGVLGLLYVDAHPPRATVASEEPRPKKTKKAKKASSSSSSSRVLFGEVLTKEENPVAGARIEALAGSDNVVVVDVRTGADGQFTLDGLPVGLNAVRFSAPGFVEVTVDVATLPAASEAFWSQHLASSGAGVRVVVVAAEDGHALAGVTLKGVNGGAPRRRSGRDQDLGVTDAGGVVVLVPAEVPDGHVVVVVDPLRGAYELTERERSSEAEVRIALPAPATVRGRVLDKDAQGVREATFSISRPRVRNASAAELALIDAQARNERRAADDDGRFEVQLAAGTIVVQASGAGMRPGDSGEISLVSGVTTDVVVELTPSPRVLGRVVDADSGDGIALCTVTPDGREEGARPATTDVDGAFVLDSLVERPSSLQVECPSYRQLTLGGLDGARHRPEALRIEMSKGAGNVVAGVGVSLRRIGRGVRITMVQPDTPAERAGLHVDDIIEAVDETPVNSRSTSNLETAMALIRGQPGTWVRLQIRSGDGTTRTVEVERALINVPTN